LPLPELPEVMVSQVVLLCALHPHPFDAVTGADPVPPAAPIDALAGFSADTQVSANDQTPEELPPSPFLAVTDQ
jgi:hypothetical protein